MSDNTQNSFIKRFTKSEKFVNEKKESWKTLHDLIIKINNKGLSSLTPAENLDFPNLYRMISTDSELAKTLELSPDTLEYINTLLLHSHNIFYTSVKRNIFDIAKSLFNDFSKAFIKNWLCYFTAFILFFGSLGISFFVIYKNPELAVYTIPKEFIDNMKEMYSQDITDKRDLFSNIYMYGYYIYNNISIAFMSFIGGITYGLLTVFYILYNGVFIGSFGGLVFSAGYGTNFINFVTAHSVFELLGIVLAGGSGLALGVSLIAATEEKRTVSIVKKAQEIMPVVFIAAFFIFLAAFIEGFISPTKIHYLFKVVIALISLAIVLFFSYKYLFVLLIKKKKRS